MNIVMKRASMYAMAAKLIIAQIESNSHGIYALAIVCNSIQLDSIRQCCNPPVLDDIH